MKTFEEALKELMGSGAVNRRTPVTPATFRMPETSYAPVDFMAGAYTGNDLFAGKPKSSINDQWWMKALDATSALGKVGSISLGSKIDNAKKMKDDILNKGFFSGLDEFAKMLMPVDFKGVGSAAGKGQAEAWFDNKFSFGDIPGMGALYGVGRYGDGYEKALNKLGAKGAGAKWTGLGMDILLDPSMYLTGGGTAAGKVGAAAMKNTAKGLAEEAGITLTSKALKSKTLAEDVGSILKNKHLSDNIGNASFDTFTSGGKNIPKVQAWNNRVGAAKKDFEMEEIIHSGANGIHTRAVDQILNAGKKASAARQNDLLALSIPFTNKVSPGIGKKPAWMASTPVKIGAPGALAVSKSLEEIGLTGDEASKFVKAKYGVDNIEDMSKDALDHFRQQVPTFAKTLSDDPNSFKEAFTNFQTHTDLNPTMDYKKFSVEDLLSQMGPMAKGRVEPMLRGMMGREGTDITKLINNQGADAAEMLGRLIAQTSNKNKAPLGDIIAKQMKEASGVLRNASNKAEIKFNPTPAFSSTSELIKPSVSGEGLAKSISDFVQGPGGKTNAQRKIDQVNPFNMRSMKSEDELVRNAGNYKADANTKILGQNHQSDLALKKLDKDMKKNLTDGERRMVAHMVQGKFPKSMGAPSQAVMVKIAPYVQQLEAMLKEIAEREMQAGTLQNTRKNYFPHVMKPGANLDEMPALPEIDSLRGQSQANSFAQERKGFQSLADWEDAVDSLRASGKTDEADKLAQLYESDPIRAVGQRSYKSIKSSAFKEMYGRMEADGLIVKRESAGVHRLVDSKGKQSFIKIDDDMAKVTGLKAGDMVHKDIVEGLKDVRELFTNAGMNKWMKHLGSVNSTWKLLVTATPSHHINNFIGNVAVTMMAGVKPSAYKEAHQLLKGMKAGEKPAVIKQAIDHGVIDQGFISDFVRSPFMDDTNLSGLDKFNQKISGSGPIKWMSDKGEKLDNISRLAMYVDRMKRYGTAEKAAGDVRKYLFNYSEMTQADKNMRTVVPFWNWVKNAVPMMTKSFYEHHGALQGYAKVKDQLNEGVGEDNPAYKTANYVKIPGTDIGMPLRLPFSELDKFGNPLHMMKEGFNMLTPAAKIPMELTQNKQFFNGAPVYRDESKMSDIGEYLLRQTGVIGKAGTGIQDTTSGKSSILDFLASFTTGKPVRYE
jgi:hypothetical protein